MKANYYLSDLKVSLTIKSYWPDQSTVKCNYHLTYMYFLVKLEQ